MIYAFQLGHLPFAKVGFSADPDRRVTELQQHLPIQLQKVASMEGSRKAEGRLHKKLSHWRTQGEWYAITPEFIVKISSLFGCELSFVIAGEETHLSDFFARREHDVQAEREFKKKITALTKTHRRESLDRDGMIRALRSDNARLEEQIRSMDPVAAAERDDLSDEIRRTMAEAEAAVARMEEHEQAANDPTIEERLRTVEKTLAAVVEGLRTGRRSQSVASSTKKVPRRRRTC